MEWSSFVHRGHRATYVVDLAEGPETATPLVFLHGMGGESSQPMGYTGRLSGRRRIALDARGHGRSDGIGGAGPRFEDLTGDVLALLDHLGLERVVLGGISMGAAIALDAAVRAPARLDGLVLCRPAWTDRPQAESNRATYRLIADLLESAPDAEHALGDLVASALYRRAEQESPSAAASLRHQVLRPAARENADLLRTLPGDHPSGPAATWSALTVPTAVIGHHDDPFHPWSIAEFCAAAIPDAGLVEVPSKDRDAQGFATRIDATIRAFLDALAARSAA